MMIKRSSNPDELQPEDRDRRSDTQFYELETVSWRLSMRSPIWKPPTDVYETEDVIVVRVEIAGMREEDFSLGLNGRVLTIRGIRSDQPERRAYHQMEIHFGEFAIELELPQHIDANRVEAVYNNGFLRIVLPKAQPRQITITE